MSLDNPILTIIEGEKCEDIYYISEPGHMAANIIIASGLAMRHISSIADKISQYAKEHNIKAMVDNSGDGSWIAIDILGLDTIVHLFTKDRRASFDFNTFLTAKLGIVQNPDVIS